MLISKKTKKEKNGFETTENFKYEKCIEKWMNSNGKGHFDSSSF